MLALAYEIGGTNTRAAIVDTDTLGLIGEQRAPTPNFHSHGMAGIEPLLSALTSMLSDLAGELTPLGEPDAIAVGYPGPVSPQGVALSSPTLLGAKLDRPLDVAALVRRAVGRKRTVVINDVTACGYRYVANGHANFALVNVGSGVGNKVFIGGCPLTGPEGRGGEFGHYTVDMRPDAPSCECGGRGHLAGMCSGRGIERAIRQAATVDHQGFSTSRLGGISEPSSIETAAIAAAFRQGDPWTAFHITLASRPLACALAGLHTSIGIERFILVGGFALALGPKWRDILVSQCLEACWNLGQDWDRMIELGETGDRDGLIGLGYAARRTFLG